MCIIFMEVGNSVRNIHGGGIILSLSLSFSLSISLSSPSIILSLSLSLTLSLSPSPPPSLSRPPPHPSLLRAPASSLSHPVLQMDYINTSHPNFVGGSRAVEMVLQRQRSERVSFGPWNRWC